MAAIELRTAIPGPKSQELMRTANGGGGARRGARYAGVCGTR